MESVQKVKKYSVSSLLFVAMMLLLSTSAVYADELLWDISAEQWAHPRSGQNLAQMSSLQSALQALNADQASVLVIRYPGGEEGSLWVSELKDWLVSLGLPSSRIQTRAGQSNNETITLMLSSSGGE